MNKIIIMVCLLLLTVNGAFAVTVSSGLKKAESLVSTERFPEKAAKVKVVSLIAAELQKKCKQLEMKVKELSTDLNILCEYKEKRWFSRKGDRYECEGRGTAECRRTFLGF